MPSLYPFNQILRRFFIPLAMVEFMCPGTTGMAVDLKQGAAAFPGEAGGFGFQLLADAPASGGFIDGKVADSGNVAIQGYLRDEVEGEEGEELVPFGPNEERLGGVGEHSGEAGGDKAFRSRVLELGEKAADAGGISRGCQSDHTYYFVPNQLLRNCWMAGVTVCPACSKVITDTAEFSCTVMVPFFSSPRWR